MLTTICTNHSRHIITTIVDGNKIERATVNKKILKYFRIPTYDEYEKKNLDIKLINKRTRRFSLKGINFFAIVSIICTLNWF